MNQWNDKQLIEKVKRIREDQLEVTGAYVAGITSKNVSGQGDPPLEAVDYGQHLNSIFFQVNPSGESVRVGFDGSAEHSIYVELGTHKMPARPSLRRAVEDNKQTIKELLRVQ